MKLSAVKLLMAEAVSEAILAERERAAQVVRDHSGGHHCCVVAEDGTVETKHECTCWRSKILDDIMNPKKEATAGAM